MEHYCVQCGRQIFDTAQLCFDCLNKTPQPNGPFAGTEYAPRAANQTQPFGLPPEYGRVGDWNAAFDPQAVSHCPFCGGAGGIFAKSTITAAGFIYMGVMFAFTLILFVVFFPCAIIPFGLLFLGLLFKEKHFACVNCGQNLS